MRKTSSTKDEVAALLSEAADDVKRQLQEQAVCCLSVSVCLSVCLSALLSEAADDVKR